MKTLDKLFDNWGSKTMGNFMMTVNDKFMSLEHFGVRIAYVDLGTGHFMVHNPNGNSSSVRAVRYASIELKNRGYKEIVWGSLKYYPQKGTYFVTKYGEQYSLSTYYPIEKHMKNPSALVYGTLIMQDGKYVVNHVAFNIDHLAHAMSGWHKGEINYL